MINFSRLLAWLYFLCSVVGGILVLVNYSTKEELLFTYSREVINPVGIGAGLGVLLQGGMAFCLLMLVARIAENTGIKENTKITSKLDNYTQETLLELESPEAIHEAVWNGDYELVRKLIRKGYDTSYSRSSDGKTPLELAIERKDGLIIKLLESNLNNA